MVSRIKRWMPIGPILAAVAAAWRGPHLMLRARLAAGSLPAASVPVVVFTPPEPAEPTVCVRVGELAIDVPTTMQKERALDGGASVVLRSCDLVCTIVEPRPDRVRKWREELPCLALWCGDLDEVGVRAAVYAAAHEDFSWWMSGAEAFRLVSLLSGKRMLSRSVENVEIVRGHSVKGVLQIRRWGDDTILVYDYFATDETCGGFAVLSVVGGNAAALRSARSLVGSFRLAPSASDGVLAASGHDP